MSRHLRWVAWAAWAVAGAASAAFGQADAPSFEDRTAEAFGTIPRGPSFGAGAWGDFDGDGLPDLWLSKHAGFASLWWNQGNGCFLDVAPIFFAQEFQSDAHGAAWADFDRDGDLDLAVCIGAELGAGIGPNELWVNHWPLPFQDLAAAHGVDDPRGRSRTPLWLDWNGDGWLDLVTTAFRGAQSEDRLFTQQAGADSFRREGAASGFVPTGRNTRYAQLADFDTDGRAELLLHARGFPDRLFTLDASGLQEIELPPGVPRVANVQDAVLGDFDGDLDFDAYCARDPYWSASEAAVDEDGSLRVALRVTGGSTSFRFRCEGPWRVRTPRGVAANEVVLGAERHPADELPLTLDPRDRRCWGLAPFPPGSRSAICIGRETDSSTWQVTVVSPTDTSIAFVIESSQPLEDAAVLGAPQASPPDLLVFSSSEGTRWSLLEPRLSGRSVVAGDFDNDADLDLYVVRSGAVRNLPNRLLLNDGHGNFTPAPDSAMAEGPRRGSGDSVSVADYDGDGFLDLLLTNGWGQPPLVDDFPVQLLRNRGNENHWLQVDLVGTRDNPHGLGATVELLADRRRQIRFQDGGMHRSTQNHMRLHFGLGASELVQELTVRWPDGSTQTLLDLPANRVVRVVQQ